MPWKQDCPKICALQDGGVPRNSTHEVECCSGRAPGGRLVCPVAWDIVWGFILLDFGCKKDIFYIEIIGFMVY